MSILTAEPTDTVAAEQRQPLAPQPTHTYRAVVIGSGFGGQAAAIALRERGIEDFVILERRPFLGGTWSQNVYPGAAVDVPSPLYSLAGDPFDWSQMYAEQDELERYTEFCLTKHGLREKAVTGATVVEVRWTGEVWEVRTEEQGTFRGQFLINASGPLSQPVIPPFPGLDTFAGPSFHTNCWDESVDLRGKRVAVVGSGASAAQVIPSIQPEVAELHVFQRTPHWVMARPDRHFRWWERRLMRIPAVNRAVRTAIYLKLETRVIGFKYSPLLLKLVAEREARKLLERQVADPDLRARLTPNYTIGCKRIVLSSTLYPALCAENATLHDRTDAIDHLDETGIVTTKGTHVDLDVIVWATGYDATDGVVSYPVIGTGGRTVGDAWSDFPRAYLGTTIPGFPNLFVITGPNTGIGHTSAVFLIESQMQYVMNAIETVLTAGATSVEVTAEAEDRYTSMIHRELKRTVWVTGGCHSWYQSKDGHVIAMFPGFSFTFRRWTGHFRPADHIIR